MNTSEIVLEVEQAVKKEIERHEEKCEHGVNPCHHGIKTEALDIFLKRFKKDIKEK